MIATAWAQGAGAPGGPSALVQFLPFVLVFVIFYVLVVRPEQQKRQQHRKMLGELKRNDAVVLASGLHGRVVALADDTITVEIAPKVQVLCERSAVERVQGDAESGREKERQKS